MCVIAYFLTILSYSMIPTLLKFSAFTAAALLTYTMSHAAVVIVNSGFELPAHTANNGTNPTGWTVIETTSGANPDRQVRTRNTAFNSGAMGVQLGAGNSDHTGELWQAVTTDVGQQYSFSIWASVFTDSNSPATQNFSAVLRDGSGTTGTALTTVTSAGLLSTTWQEFTGTFTATTTTTTIHLSDISTAVSGDGNDVFLDDVSITAIPEPGTTSLALLSGIGLIFRRRR
jgi:hypothetical protein